MSAAPPPDRGKLLLVDDEPDIRTVAGMALSQLGGWTVLEAGTGAAGLESARTLGPDLVLLDVMLPDTDGPSVFSELRRAPETRKLPVIFMTARTQSHERARYASLGALGVIEKPFDPLTLASDVERLLAATSSSLPSQSAAAFELEEAVSAFRQGIPDRVAAIDAAIRRALETGGSEHEARGLAHRLAGTAGTFGHRELGELARRIEVALSTPADWGEAQEAMALLAAHVAAGRR